MSDKVTEEELKVLVYSNMRCLRVYDAYRYEEKPCPVCGHTLLDAPEFDDGE